MCDTRKKVRIVAVERYYSKEREKEREREDN